MRATRARIPRCHAAIAQTLIGGDRRFPSREMHSPIRLPAGLSLLGTLRPLFSVADSLETYRRQTERLKKGMRRIRAPVAQAEIVLGGAAFVAVALQYDRCGREIGQNRTQRFGVQCQGGPRILADFALVVIEVDILNLGRDSLLERLGNYGGR